MKDLKQALDAIATPDERFKALHARYAQLIYENKKREREYALMKRKYEQANRDKDAGKFRVLARWC